MLSLELATAETSNFHFKEMYIFASSSTPSKSGVVSVYPADYIPGLHTNVLKYKGVTRE